MLLNKCRSGVNLNRNREGKFEKLEDKQINFN
jgi:hypothetical protein